MIGLIFQFGSEIVEVRIDKSMIYFRTSQFMNFSTIDGLKLNRSGVIKEFPDLANDENWKQIAIQRFKDKIKSMETEEQISNYILEDLKKFGYVPLYKQKQGYRREKII